MTQVLVVALLALALFAAPLAVPAQPAGKGHRMGFLGVGSRAGRAFLLEGFLQGLREHGYVEDRNIIIDGAFAAMSRARADGLIVQ